MTRRFLRGSLLALGLALGLTGLTYANTDDDGDCVGGRSAGRWELPDAHNFGHARGILAIGDRPVLGMNAALLQNPHTDRRGRIEGVIHTLATGTSEAEPVAQVFGSYHTRNGVRGVFTAFFVRPTALGPMLIGGMHGGFADPDHEEGDGRYRARWRICRPGESDG